MQCGQLHSELFGRRHIILQPHGLFALAKRLSTTGVRITLYAVGKFTVRWANSVLCKAAFFWDVRCDFYAVCLERTNLWYVHVLVISAVAFSRQNCYWPRLSSQKFGWGVCLHCSLYLPINCVYTTMHNAIRVQGGPKSKPLLIYQQVASYVRKALLFCMYTNSGTTTSYIKLFALLLALNILWFSVA